MTRDELKAVVLEALVEHDRAKAARKPKRTLRDDLELVVKEMEPRPIVRLWNDWTICVGATDIGRVGKAFKPLIAVYDTQWIAAGIRSYAAELHRDGKMKYASPENFASRATGYILPSMPVNELTEREAALIGMTESRNHMDTLGLLTDRARG